MRELSEATILALHALHTMVLKREPVSIEEVRRSSGVKAARVRQIVAKLQRAGLVEGRAGRGYLLAKAPGQISIQDIVRSIEKPQTPSAPCGGNYEACASRASCFLAPLCHSADQSHQDVLRTFTLAELMDVPLDTPNCLDPKLRIKAS